jgi:hypothetical protein
VEAVCEYSSQILVLGEKVKLCTQLQGAFSPRGMLPTLPSDAVVLSEIEHDFSSGLRTHRA